MTLTIDLSQEQEVRLIAQANVLGIDATEYARRLLDRALNEDSDEAWEADMRALAEGCEDLPVLSPEAFTRESIYGARG